jgi:hypothetical protein
MKATLSAMGVEIGSEQLRMAGLPHQIHIAMQHKTP